MGHPDGAHTHGGGGFDPMPLLIIIGAIAVAGPVMAAVAELVHILLIVAAVLLGLAAAAVVAFIAYRLRHPRTSSPPSWAVRPPPQPQAIRGRAEPRRALERPAVHLHFPQRDDTGGRGGDPPPAVAVNHAPGWRVIPMPRGGLATGGSLGLGAGAARPQAYRGRLTVRRPTRRYAALPRLYLAFTSAAAWLVPRLVPGRPAARRAKSDDPGHVPRPAAPPL